MHLRGCKFVKCSLFKLKSLFSNKTIINGSLFSFFAFLNNGIGFLLLFILASFLSPGDYGILNLYTTLVTVFTILIPLNTLGLIAINFFNPPIQNLYRIINVILLIAFCSFVFFSLIVFLGREKLEEIVSVPSIFQWIVLICCFFQLISNICLEIWRLEEKPIPYGLFSTASVLLNAFLSILFVACFHLNWEGRVYAQLLTCFCFTILGLFFLFKKGYLKKVNIDIGDVKSTLRFGVPLIPHDISVWLRQGVDRFIINYYHTPVLVGLFGFALNFANVIQIVALAFNATNAVFIYKQLASGDSNIKGVLRKQTHLMLLFYVLLSFGVSVCSYFFIPLAFPTYMEAVIFVFPLCGAALAQCFYLVYVNYLFYYRKTVELMYITSSVSVLHIILSLWLSRYSVLYTSYIHLVSNVLIAVLVYIYSQRIYSLKD